MFPTEPGYYWALPLNKYVSRESVIVQVVQSPTGELKALLPGVRAYHQLEEFEQWEGPVVR